MKVSSNLLIHHHAFAFIENDKVWIQSFIGIWVQEFSKYFDEIGLLSQVSNSRRPEQDYQITADNVILHRLNPPVKCNRFKRNKHIRQVCKTVSPYYDSLLIRGITPRQKLIFDNCDIKNKFFLLVGSLIESKPILHFDKISIITWVMFWFRRYQLKKISKSAIMLANSPVLTEEIYSILRVNAKFIPTNTISRKDIVPFRVRNIQTPINILFCGRVIKEKGIEELIEAQKLLMDSNIQVILDIIGDIPEDYRATLYDKVIGLGLQSYVKFHGFIPFGEDLLEFYRRADIYVLPSWHEGFPHSVWEAAASCTPIIISSVGGIPGLVSEEEVFFIESKNPQSIQKAVQEIITNSVRTSTKIKKAYQLILEYTIENCVERAATIIHAELNTTIEI